VHTFTLALLLQPWPLLFRCLPSLVVQSIDLVEDTDIEIMDFEFALGGVPGERAYL
jgi:hypothetical protein